MHNRDRKDHKPEPISTIHTILSEKRPINFEIPKLIDTELTDIPKTF